MNWLVEELEAEKNKPIVDDAPGYTRAQQKPLEELCMGNLSHRDMANKVRMLMRTDWQHEAVVTACRDRIAWLAAENERLNVEHKASVQELVMVCAFMNDSAKTDHERLESIRNVMLPDDYPLTSVGGLEKKEQS